jgi:peptidyl-prolyl cis-trans isomerase B (cyclophilin B)
MKSLIRIVAMGLALALSTTAHAQPAASAEEGASNVTVNMQTNRGTIVLELDRDRAPVTVENFVSYARQGFYDGTIFHRVIPGFMIQGGGFEPGMNQKPTDSPIKNEADNGLSNVTGTIAMARTPNPHSATAQFFINVSDNKFLDHTAPTPQGWGYTVFGRVVDGMEVVQEIVQVPTTSRAGHQDVPVDDVVIEKVTIEGEG